MNLVEATFFNWQKRAENDQLEDKLPEPEKKPQKTDQDRLNEALKIIVKHPDWGGVKVSHYLLNKEICYLSPSTINRIKANLNECLDLSKLNFVQRYEFINSNDCWSLDFTQFNWGDETLYLCFIQDDHSRFIIDWDITASPTCEFVKELLKRAFKQHGKPETIKSDNGPQFRNQFLQFLESWLIKHHVSPYYTPNYNGKVERKNLDFKNIIKQVNYESTTLEELFVIIGNAIYEHNNIRPHQSLGGVTPKQEYEGFGDKVRSKMEAFKKKEKELKGFKTKKKIVFPNDKNKAKVKGIIVPAFLINNPEKTAGYVKKLNGIKL